MALPDVYTYPDSTETTDTGSDVQKARALENRRNRIRLFEAQGRQYPGVLPNSSGPTGLRPSDANGWSDILHRQRQYTQDVADEQGAGPITYRQGPQSTGVLGGSGGDASSPMRGLQTAISGGGGRPMGAMAPGDGDTGTGYGADAEIARLQRARMLQDLQGGMDVPTEFGMSTAATRARTTGQQQLGEDVLTGEHIKDVQAQRGGQRYYMPEVAGPREEDIANRLEAIRRQYIEPAQIKQAGDLGAAELGLEGQQVGAEGRTNAARLTGAASIRAASERAGGDRSTADARLLGQLAQFGFTKPEDQAALLGLVKSLRDQGVIR